MRMSDLHIATVVCNVAEDVSSVPDSHSINVDEQQNGIYWQADMDVGVCKAFPITHTYSKKID